MSDDAFDRVTAVAGKAMIAPIKAPTMLDAHLWLIDAVCQVQNRLTDQFGWAGEESGAMVGLYEILEFLTDHSPDNCRPGDPSVSPRRPSAQT